MLCQDPCSFVLVSGCCGTLTQRRDLALPQELVLLRVVRAAVDKLRAARASGDLHALVSVIRPCLVKNFGGIMNFEMYTQVR